MFQSLDTANNSCAYVLCQVYHLRLRSAGALSDFDTWYDSQAGIGSSVDMDMFDLQDHPILTAAPFPERGVKTTLVLKPLAFADRLRGDARSVRYDHGMQTRLLNHASDICVNKG